MAGTRDSFVDLERHRLQLEQNISKLRASLRHWQQWEFEYEYMKDDVLAVANVDTPVDSVGSFCTLNLRNTEIGDRKAFGKILAKASIISLTTFY